MMCVNTNTLRDGLMAVAAKYNSADGDAYMWRCKAVYMGAHALRMVGLISSLRDANGNPMFPDVSDSLDSANQFIEDYLFRRRVMERVYQECIGEVDGQYLVEAWQFWAGVVEKQSPEEQLAWVAVWAQMQPEVRTYLASLH